MKNLTLKIVNTISFVVMVAINVLANILPIGIGNTGEISERYPNLFTPAPITFTIWAVIYLLMATFILYQWGLIGSKEASQSDVKRIDLWFALSCAFNIGWIFAWHFNVIALSMIMMIGLLISLIVIERRLIKRKRRRLSYLSANIGFDVYFGWIIAATIANLTVFLVSLNWDGFGLSPVFWTSIVLVAGAFIGSVPVIFFNRWFSTIAVLWAYIGILIRHISDTGFFGAYPAIITMVVASIGILLASIVVKLLIRSTSNRMIPVKSHS